MITKDESTEMCGQMLASLIEAAHEVIDAYRAGDLTAEQIDHLENRAEHKTIIALFKDLSAE